MRVGIIGAGVAGLTAAYDLTRAGHTAVVLESAPNAGGLASGFRAAHWDWHLERFYHHIFQTDTAIIELARQIGIGDTILFRKPPCGQWWHNRGYDLNGAVNVLRYPGLPLADRVRFGLVVAYLKYLVNDWRPLEQVTAAEWSRRAMGLRAYRDLLLPVLEGKFGPFYREVNMAWLWARFKTRTFQLGYFAGGFQAFVDALLARVQAQGADVRLATPVRRLSRTPQGWEIVGDGMVEQVDAVLATTSPGLLARLAPELPGEYLGHLRTLRSLGAVVMVLALDRKLAGGLYWVNMPKDEFPFLIMAEHTSFMPPERYGGDHLVYLGDYLPADHDYFRLSHDELLARFLPALQRVHPQFDRAWIRDSWLHREPYAQPLVTLGHSEHIPPLATPLPGLYWASMSQVYPWDRGTNFAVELGQRAAGEIDADARRLMTGDRQMARM